MKTSQSIAEITKALVAFDQENPVIKKNTKAKLGSFTIEYADLESIISEVRPLLSKNGLRITHTFDGMFSEVMVSHISGEFIVSCLSMPQPSNDPKATGALISYYRRYQLNAILGLAADDADTDLIDFSKKEKTITEKKTELEPARCKKCGGAVEKKEGKEGKPYYSCKQNKGECLVEVNGQWYPTFQSY